MPNERQIGVPMKTAIATTLCLLLSAPTWAQPAPAPTPVPATEPEPEPEPATEPEPEPVPETQPAPPPEAAPSAQASASASYSLSLGGDGEASGRGSGLSTGDDRAGRGIQIGALVGFGLSFDDNVGAVNPLGLGLGLMGGGHLGALYLGLRGHVYLGGGSDLPTGRLNMQEWLLAAEAGYDIDLGSALVLRPGLLLGAAFFNQDGPPRSIPAGYIAGTQDQAYGRLYLAPGAGLLLPFGRLSRDLSFLYAGLDLRVGLFLGDPSSGALEAALMLGIAL